MNPSKRWVSATHRAKKSFWLLALIMPVLAGCDAFSWGDDAEGQLGDGVVGGSQLAPGASASGFQWKELRAGWHHTCGVREDNTLWCWGANSPQLCADTGAIASAELGINPLGPPEPSSDFSRLALSSSSSVLVRNGSDLGAAGSYPLGAVSPGRPAWAELEVSEALLTSQDNGIIRRLDPTTSSVTEDWSVNLRRAGCSSDSVVDTPMVQRRIDSTAAFQSSSPDDLVYVGTRYSNATGTSCSGENTDNRIQARLAGTGSLLWEFNAAKSFEVDVLTGFALAPASDLLVATADRTPPPSTASGRSTW